MNAQSSLPPGDASPEVAALIETLHDTGQRLEELTAGEVDTVADGEGRTFVLRSAQEQLRQVEAARQAAILNALPAHIALLDNQGVILSVNEAWRRFSGAHVLQGPGYGIGVNYLGACDGASEGGPSEGHEVAEGIRSVLGGVNSFSIEYACHSPPHKRWFRLTVTPLDEHSNGAVVMQVEVTAERQAAEKLRESDRRFKDLLRNVDLISMMLDLEARVTYCNEYLLHLTGWRYEEVIGRNWFDIFIPSHEHDRKDNFNALLRNLPEAWHHENEILTRSGERRFIRWNNSVLRSIAGAVIGTASIGEDITEQRRVQESLQQNEERMRSIVESALDAVVVMNSAGRIADWNTQAEKTFGWRREQVIDTLLAETIIPPRYREAHARGLCVFLETGEGPVINKRIELSAMHQVGHEFPVELTVSPVRLGEEWIFCSFIRDLTQRKRAEQAIEQLRRQSDLILQSVGEGIYGIDVEGRISFENPSAAKLLGYEFEELSGKPAHALIHHTRKDGSSYPVEECPIHITMQDGVIRRIEDEVFWRKDGSSFPVEVTTAPIRNERSEITGAVIAFRDVTDRLEAENRIKRLNRVNAVLSSVNALILRVRDRNELFKEACRIAVEVGAFRLAWIALIEPHTQELKIVAWHGGKESDVNKILLTARDGAPDSERPASRALRQFRPIVCNDVATDPSVASYRDDLLGRGDKSLACFPLTTTGRPEAVIALFAGEADVFDDEEMRVLMELAGNLTFAMDHIEKGERLNYLAYYDVLTGLANRSLFIERAAQVMRGAVSGGHKFALFLIDLERFKNINDSLGQAAGDALLRQVAEWLTQNVVDANLLARVGADHFAVVLPEVKQEGEVARFLEKTMKAFLEHPFHLNGAEYRIAARVGIAVFPDDGADADTLFKNAEAALKKAKASGDRYVFYTQKMAEMVAGRFKLESQLRQALENEEFVLHYQPKISLAGDKLSGAEALIRWNDPRTGLVPPGRFIPILEETGLIYEVGRWALRKAIEDYLRWRAAGLAAVRIAVNVSPLQLRDRGFIAEIKEAIGIDANAAAGLELEITESMVMEDVKQNIASLQAIRAMGVSIAIDDFGTGFSSLSHLSKLPVDTLKIDRSFVIDMTTAPEGLALVSTIITLAHSLKLKVVAEGVETEEQSRLLRLLACDEMQGYLFSKPVPRDMFEARFLAPAPAGTKGRTEFSAAARSIEQPRIVDTVE